MGLFQRRNAGDTAFWRQPPFRSSDPAALYQHGITCVTLGDPVGMMQVGWTIWRLVGLHQHQARDFLYDGFTLWQEGGQRVRLHRDHTYTAERGLAFLRDYFDTLCASPPPPCPPNIWQAPPELVQPASDYYSTRCFAGTRLVTMAEAMNDAGTVATYRPRVYRAITEVPDAGFVPPFAMSLARAMAAEQGLPDPFA